MWYCLGMKNGTNGSRRPGHTIGRKSFAKICAVEGIRITAAMEADFRDFERRGLSADERRKALASKYGKSR